MSSGERDEIMRKFGMLFQGGALFDSLPVWENVAFGLIPARGFNRAEAKEIALQKLAAVGLGRRCRRALARRAVRRHAEARVASPAPSRPSRRSSSSTSRPPASTRS